MPHHRKSVAIVKAQVVGSQQFHTATRHPADIDPVGGPQMQMSQQTTIEVGSGQHHLATLHIRVERVPVDIAVIPVLRLPLAKQNFHCRHFLLGGDSQHPVAHTQHRSGMRAL